jgi:hypothetical protein
VRGYATVRSYLHDAIGGSRGVHHRTAFLDGVADRLFYVNVCPLLHSLDHAERVPVIRRRNDGDVRLLLAEALTVVLVLPGLVSRKLYDFRVCF